MRLVWITTTILAWMIFFLKPFSAYDGCALGMLTGIIISMLLWEDGK